MDKIKFTNTVRDSLPIIDAILAAVSNVNQVGPYAQVLRILTQAGVSALANESSALISRMREVHLEMTALSKDDPEYTEKYPILKTRMDAYLDLLLTPQTA